MIEIIGSIYSIIMNVVGLMVCIFHYVSKPRKVWVYAIIVLIFNFLSNYYWGAYVIIMNGEYPSVSSILAYFGWNMAYLAVTLMVFFVCTKSDGKFFSPIALIPIPFNIWQFTIYIQYGGIFNNTYQVGVSTITMCLCINSIVYYLKNKDKEGIKKPYIQSAILVYVIAEYVMWTSSCFDWPSEWLYPYNYATIIESAANLFVPWAIIKTFNDKTEKKSEGSGEGRMKKYFRPVYLIFVVLFCVLGIIIAIWMKTTINNAIVHYGNTDPFNIVAVMLFFIGSIIVLFTISLLFIVNFEQKSIESARLRDEKVMAERSNAAKSEFLANMSHEIRTPINAVLGMNEMILNESLQARDMVPDDKERISSIFSSICNYSGNISSAGSNLLSIINDILDFSKIEAGKMEIVNTEYKLSSVLNDVSNMISFKARSKNLKFGVDVDESIPDGLFGDEVRIRQVITNVLNNAVKYTEDGSVTLIVDTKDPFEKGGSSFTNLVVKVRDTGIGIKEEDLKKLFSKFQRVDLEKNSSIEGTGLGLAITESLLDMMGGKIEVESEYGKGSIFTITLPQKIVSDEPIGDFKKKVEKSMDNLTARKESFRAPNARILVVDDTKMNITVVKGLLKKTEMVIDSASSGKASIDLCRENRYDVILMDQRMPEMDGITAMHIIKEDEGSLNKETPFICLTADAVTGARERYMSEGFTDYLTKPIDSDDLKEKLVESLPAEKILDI